MDTKLIKKETVAKDTMAFYFEKPTDYVFTPGQHLTVKLINPPETDEEGNERTFSLITTPSDAQLGIATRMRDTAFKRTIKNMELNSMIQVSNSRGSMVLPETSERELVFLAGGIGITPFMSMVRKAAQNKFPYKIYLFYSNRTIEDSAFFEELKKIAQENPNFIFIPVMTKEAADKWTGETAYINKDMVLKYITSTQNKVFYLAGPSAMVAALTEVLTALQVDLLFIKSEDYGEYGRPAASNP